MPSMPQGNARHSSWADDKKNYESVDLQKLVWCIQPYNYPDQKFFQEEDINLPKVPLSHIFTALEKCPLRREKEALEDESGHDGFTLLASAHWEYHFPSVKEKSNDLGDLGFEENWLSVRQRV